MNVTPECICEVKENFYYTKISVHGKPSPLMQKCGYEYNYDKKEYYIYSRVPFDELKEIKTIIELIDYCFKIAGQMRGLLQKFTGIR
jgi:collagenase-like PrtC family protease